MWILFALVVMTALSVFVWSCIRVGDASKTAPHAMIRRDSCVQSIV